MNIVHFSISLSSGGGIAELMRQYAIMFPNFMHISTCSDREGRVSKSLHVIYAAFKLLLYRALHGAYIAHFHGASFSSFRRKLLLSRLAKILGCKVIYHLHAGDFVRFHKSVGTSVLSDSLNSYDAVVVLSTHWKTYIQQNFACERVYVINNVVPEPSYNSATSDFNQNYLHVLYMGALYESKGVYDILKSIKDNMEEIRERVRIHVCGGRTDSEIRRFTSAMSEYALEDIVVYHGWVGGREKSILLKCSDALILPSYYEGLPMCILEAMSYGKPIIATSVGSVPEIVRHEENGYLFQPGDLKNMYLSIIKLASLPDKGKEMGYKSEQMIKNFYPPTVKKQLVALYLNIEAM